MKHDDDDDEEEEDDGYDVKDGETRGEKGTLHPSYQLT